MKVENYKGHPILVLEGNKDEREVRLGLTKCKAVLANTDTLKAFVAQYDRPKSVPQTPPPAVPDVRSIVALLQSNPNILAALQTVTSQQPNNAPANGRFNPVK